MGTRKGMLLRYIEIHDIAAQRALRRHDTGPKKTKKLKLLSNEQTKNGLSSNRRDSGRLAGH